jgi:nitroimidazol reductase NimA-like FMN-containing flavoprotein (pyridoxamine 5'-phosphate oxidase superfamily)
MLDPGTDGWPHSPQLVALARSECLTLLAARSFGRVIVTTGDEHRPLIRPVSYRFDHASQSVAFRTASGTKLHALLRSASACFEIDEIDAEARAGWSVIVYGITERVVHPTEILRLERFGLDSLAPGPQPDWIRVRATTITGMRIKQAPAAN